jgi:hypothetical protein
VGLSVDIPVAIGDGAWKILIADLKALTAEDEVIISSPSPLNDDLVTIAKLNGLKCRFFYTTSPHGRAKQLNAGVMLATKEFVWLLHCDSKVSALGIEKLKSSLRRAPMDVQYFDLCFLNDGPSLMKANNLGVWVRSHFFGLPFGDQGFCLRRENFLRLGGFCETAPYGEDHLLIWRARQQKVKLRPVGARIFTSARRYESQGWAVTTARHLFLTFRQATPEFFRLLCMRIAP